MAVPVRERIIYEHEKRNDHKDRKKDHIRNTQILSGKTKRAHCRIPLIDSV